MSAVTRAIAAGRSHLLLVVAVLLIAAAATLQVLAVSARGEDNVGNRALVDAAATDTLKADVGTALVRLFSYDAANPEPTRQAADELLAGKARQQYDLLFDTLEKKAPGQRLTLTAEVQVAAVKELEGDKGSLLVLLDQASQRASDKEASLSAAQLSIDVERIGRTWKVTGIQPL